MSYLQEKRKALGLSQQMLSDISGVSLSTIKALESGYRQASKLSFENAIRLSESLCLGTPIYLLEVEDFNAIEDDLDARLKDNCIIKKEDN